MIAKLRTFADFGKDPFAHVKVCDMTLRLFWNSTLSASAHAEAVCLLLLPTFPTLYKVFSYFEVHEWEDLLLILIAVLLPVSGNRTHVTVPKDILTTIALYNSTI